MRSIKILLASAAASIVFVTAASADRTITRTDGSVYMTRGLSQRLQRQRAERLRAEADRLENMYEVPQAARELRAEADRLERNNPSIIQLRGPTRGRERAPAAEPTRDRFGNPEDAEKDAGPWNWEENNRKAGLTKPTAKPARTSGSR